MRFEKSTYHTLVFWGIACTFAIANFYLHFNTSPLGYDEGDYYEATQRGLMANWTDSDNMSLYTFGEYGVKALQGHIDKAALSNLVRENSSTFFLRHYHPPLPFYSAILIQNCTPQLPLHVQLRLNNVFWILLWISVMSIFFVRVPEIYSPWLVLVPASASFAMASSGFNVHLPFGLMLSSFVYLCYMHEAGYRHKMIVYGRIVFFAAALTCLSVGLFLVFFTCVWIVKTWFRSATASRSELMKRYGFYSLLLVGSILILWPAGILELNLLRTYIFTVYFALFRLQPFELSVPVLYQTLLGKWNASPLELIAGFAIVVTVLWNWKIVLTRASLFISLGLLLLLMYSQVNPTLTHQWYLFPVFAVCFCAYVPILFDQKILPQRWQYSLAAATGTAIVFFAVSLFVLQSPRSDDMLRLHNLIRSAPSATVTVPLSTYPQVKPYFPDKTLIRRHDTEYDTDYLDDSLRAWRRRGMVIVPRQFGAKLHQQANDSTQSYLFFNAVP